MKTFKNIFCCVLIAMVTVLLTGCGNKVALNKDKFISKMEAESFVISDITYQYSSYSYVNSVILAKSSDGYQIEFYEVSDSETATTLYNQNVDVMKSKKSGVSSESTVNIGNYSNYRLSSGNDYMLVSRIDNTLIYVEASDVYKDDIKGIIDDLGY